MPRVSTTKAVATADSIANLWTLAELHGEVEILVPGRREVFLIRNKVYAYRKKLRVQAREHTGIEASHLDGYAISYGELPDGSKWFFRISAGDIIEFELVIPDWWDPATIPVFDAVDADHTLASFAEAERANYAPDEDFDNHQA